MSLDEKDYPIYLSQAYLIKTGQKLNLKHPKTLNEKIQWLKIFDNRQPKSELADKVLVRDWVREKIGDEYLKPVLWIGDKFDDIPFDSLPISFVVKCNHGCKWQFTILDKDKYLNNLPLFNHTKKCIDNWLLQSFFGWSDFETQYKKIKPKIIIETLLCDDNKGHLPTLNVYCFNGVPKIYQIFDYKKHVSSFDENFKNININFSDENELVYAEPCHEVLKEAEKLSAVLAKEFKFVRVDWMIKDNKLYFEEMTFTPYSGYIFFPEYHNKWQNALGRLLNLKGD